jgi:hypothetical protein
MIELNDTNGASTFTRQYADRCLTDFPDQKLTGAEFGIAYGGGVERIGKIWKGRGVVYGFDTFEGHPKEIGELCAFSAATGGRSSFAATCMDSWYSNPDYGTERLSLEYQKGELDRQGIDNVKLIKGLVTADMDISFINELHYCLLDLDFPLSMLEAYYLVRGKIVSGGYLLLHDVIPAGHITGCNEVYKRILEDDIWDIVEEKDNYLLAILRKK